MVWWRKKHTKVWINNQEVLVDQTPRLVSRTDAHVYDARDDRGSTYEVAYRINTPKDFPDFSDRVAIGPKGVEDYSSILIARGDTNFYAAPETRHVSRLTIVHRPFSSNLFVKRLLIKGGKATYRESHSGGDEVHENQEGNVGLLEFIARQFAPIFSIEPKLQMRIDTHFALLKPFLCEQQESVAIGEEVLSTPSN